MQRLVAWFLTLIVITYYLVDAVILSDKINNAWSFVDQLFPLIYIALVASVGSGILSFVRTRGNITWSAFFAVYPNIALIFSILFLMFYHFGDVFGEYEEVPRASHAECMQVKTGSFETAYVYFNRTADKQTQVTKQDKIKSEYSIRWDDPCTYVLLDSSGADMLSAHILKVTMEEYTAEISYEDTSWIQTVKLTR